MGGERSLLHDTGGFRVNIGRADVLAALSAGEPWVFAGEIILALRRDDMDHWQGFVVQDSDGEFELRKVNPPKGSHSRISIRASNGATLLNQAFSSN